MMRALAPCEMRFSTSVNCLDADDCASAEIYLAPAASSAALMAASSVFQRSSWKLFHETPTIVWAAASPGDMARLKSATEAKRYFLTDCSPLTWTDIAWT